MPETFSLGLCGAHRTGKTTLARQFAEHSELHLLTTSTSAVFARFGLDPAAPMSFQQRLEIQGHVLEAAVELWRRHENFITDRTPLDFMAYTLADIQGGSEVDMDALTAYCDACFSALERYFSHVVLVQPGIALVAESGKAALNPAYIEHLNIVLRGLAQDERCRTDFITMPRDCLALEKRLVFCQDALKIR